MAQHKKNHSHGGAKGQSHSHTHDENHGEEHHITGNSVYIGVWIALMILTALTVWVAGFDFGAFNVVVALAIASLKATVVALYFMHLKYEDKLTWAFAIYPLFLVMLLIGLTATDVFYRVTP
ncbi:MAG: cytochrome C oxidase subunit IV family protein [Deltaproteobacteria bacterium]